MRITGVELYPVRVPIRPERQVPAALGGRDASELLLVRVLTNAGIDGVGEATGTARWSGETVWGAHAVIERVLAPLLIGCDPHDVAVIDRRMDRACKHNWFAKAALEMACWDIQGKATGRPVFALLGGPRRPLAVRGRASMGALDPASARRWTADRVAAGFTAFKIKVGGKPAEDEKRVRVVRDAIGPDCALVIDATGGWGADEAIACITALADCDVAFVEQPTRAGDYGALARVRAKTGCRVIADDACFDLVHAHELARQRCCDALSVYPGKNGGLRKAKEIVEFAAGEGLPCTIGSNLEWDVATAAMGHLVVACDNLRVETIPGDMEGPAHYTVPTSTIGVQVDGAVTMVPDRPGLGVDVDWSLIRTLRCPF